MLRFLRSTMMSAAEVTYRLVVQNDTIRVRWCAKLWMRDPLAVVVLPGKSKDAGALVQLDGVSIYELNADGLIRLHRLDDIALTGPNQEAVANLGFAWPHPELAVPTAARSFFRSLSEAALAGGPGVAVGVTSSGAPQPQPPQVKEPGPFHPQRHGAPRAPPPLASAAAEQESPMERAARERAEDAMKERRLLEKLRESQKKKDWGFGLASLAPTPCETSFDCESPMVCCDLLFASVCCSNGLMWVCRSRSCRASLFPYPSRKETMMDGYHPTPGTRALAARSRGKGGGGGGGSSRKLCD